MNIIIDIGHPAHVHVFRHYAKEFIEQGHKVLFTTKDKECTLQLLEAFDLPYECLGKPYSGVLNKMYGLWGFAKKLYHIARSFDADIMIGISSMYAAHVSTLMRIPSIILDDTEHSSFEHVLYGKFTSHIVTPSAFEKNMGTKHIRYDGYHELAYLHPKRYTPSDDIFADLGVKRGEPYSVVRFVAWNAVHDLSEEGIPYEQKLKLITKLEQFGRVFISSEKELPESLEKYRLTTQANQMHDVLAHAKLYIGEGATMASECAVLGTPSVYINTLDAGTIKEQEAYGLLYSFRNMSGVLETVEMILQDGQISENHTERRAKMVKEKIDVTAFLVQLTEKVFETSADIGIIYTKKRIKTSTASA